MRGKRLQSGHPRRVALLAVVTCLLAVLLVAASTAEAGQSGGGSCASASRAKAAQAKHKRSKRHKAKRVCKAPAQKPAPAGDSAPSAPPPSSGGEPSSPPPTFNTLTFSDDFNGNSLDASKWLPQRTDTSGYMSGPDACYVDSPNNISVSDGTLKLTARKETSPFTCGDPAGNFTTQYTSGMVTTYGRFSQAYGRFEIRAKVSGAQVPGLQSSLWLWPADASRYGSWPASGEIDVAEMFSNYADRAIPYIHYNPAGTDPDVTNTSCMITNLAAFHTYAVEWAPGTIWIIYDGHTCLVDNYNPAAPLTGGQPFDQPFIVALTQALGIGSNAFDPARTPLPATTEVDYVKVWK